MIAFLCQPRWVLRCKVFLMCLSAFKLLLLWHYFLLLTMSQYLILAIWLYIASIIYTCPYRMSCHLNTTLSTLSGNFPSWGLCFALQIKDPYLSRLLEGNILLLTTTLFQYTHTKLRSIEPILWKWSSYRRSSYQEVALACIHINYMAHSLSLHIRDPSTCNFFESAPNPFINCLSIGCIIISAYLH